MSDSHPFRSVSALLLHNPPLPYLCTVNKERPPFYNERLDGLYDLLPFYFSKIFSELPFDIIFSLMYSIPLYWMIELNTDHHAFAVFLWIIFLAIYTSRSIALFVASAIVNFHQASFVANLVYTLFLIPSGFLINLDDMWVVTAWIADISYLRFSFESMAINEFTGLTFSCSMPPSPFFMCFFPSFSSLVIRYDEHDQCH